jgi:hypothetical protein
MCLCVQTKTLPETGPFAYNFVWKQGFAFCNSVVANISSELHLHGHRQRNCTASSLGQSSTATASQNKLIFIHGPIEIAVNGLIFTVVEANGNITTNQATWENQQKVRAMW